MMDESSILLCCVSCQIKISSDSIFITIHTLFDKIVFLFFNLNSTHKRISLMNFKKLNNDTSKRVSEREATSQIVCEMKLEKKTQLIIVPFIAP